MAQIAWYGRRRSRHWSTRNAKNTNDRSDDVSGRMTFGSTGSGLHLGWLERIDEPQEEPVQELGGLRVERCDRRRREHLASAERGKRGQDRLARRDEAFDRRARRRTGRCESLGGAAHHARRLRLELGSALLAGAVEVFEDRRHELPAV